MREAKRGRDAPAASRRRATVSDTCPRMVRRPRRRAAAPYRACNMHVSIRTLSNISFPLDIPGFARLPPAVNFIQFPVFPRAAYDGGVCSINKRRDAKKKKKNASVLRTYRITMAWKESRPGARRPADQGQSPPPRHPPPTGHACTWSFQQVRPGTARLCASCSIDRRGA